MWVMVNRDFVLGDSMYHRASLAHPRKWECDEGM
jgi:hypothetical protein